MNVSIIILTKNAGNKFKDLLLSIISQKNCLMKEILIIDSGSNDNTLKIAKEFPTIIYEIPSKEFHHSKTRNFAASLSKGEYMVFITQDALPLKDDWLINILKPFENNDKIAVVYGKQKAWKYENHAEKFYYEYSFPDVAITITYDGKEKAKQNRKNNAFISNVNAAYKKEIWSRYKFSEIVDCSEDKDFAKRVLFGGYLVYYEPSAVVYHSHTFSLIQVIKKYRHFGLSLGMGVADIPQKRSSLVLKLFDYFLNEIKYLINQEKIYYIPYALMYDSCKILGTGIGKIELKIKNILKR